MLQEYINWRDAGKDPFQLRNNAPPLIVTVLDTGIDASHPALKGRVLKHFDPTGEKLVEIDSPEINLDTNGHGTAIAGLILKLYPQAYFYDVRVLGDKHFGAAAALMDGFKWAFKQDNEILNASLATSPERILQMSLQIEDAYFRNCLIIASRRNMPIRDEGYPAALVSTIGVDNSDKLPSFDSCASLNRIIGYKSGFSIEYCANGFNLPTLAPEGKYTKVTGTSFATPVISGLVARLKANFPDSSPADLKSMLSIIASDNTIA